MTPNEKEILEQASKENPFNSKKSDITIAVLAVIIKKSRKRNRTIAATSLMEIKNGLKKRYNKDLTERHILNAIRDLGKLVLKEKDPRNHRRTLYRTNPNFLKEATITLVKLNDEQTRYNNEFEGIVCSPLLSEEKKKFLAIGRTH